MALNFVRPEGSVTGKLFPSGNRTEIMKIGEKEYSVSLVDAGSPTVFVRFGGGELGLRGDESR